MSDPPWEEDEWHPCWDKDNKMKAPTYVALRLKPIADNETLGWHCGSHCIGSSEALPAILEQFHQSDPAYLPAAISGAHPQTGEPTFVLLRKSAKPETKVRARLDDDYDESRVPAATAEEMAEFRLKRDGPKPGPSRRWLEQKGVE